MKASVYIAVSLDGFIAGRDNDLGWLDAIGKEGDEDFGYQAFLDSVDVLVMGRTTYDVVRSFGQWPYGDKSVVVLSSRAVPIPDELAGTVSHLDGEPAEVVAQLEQRGAAHLYVDGGVTIQRFLRAGLVDTLILTRIPVLLGGGTSLFGDLGAPTWVEHVATRSWANGLVQSEYRLGGADKVEG